MKAEIDFRFATAEDGDRTAAAIREILLREERVNPDVEEAVSCELEPGRNGKSRATNLVVKAIWPSRID